MAWIDIQIQQHVAWLTFTREQALNALNHATLVELDQTLTQLPRDVRALVITGAGKAFVAGADIKEIQDLNANSAREFASHGQQIFRKLELLSCPVIAMVNGFALGGGLELALSCDFIIASDRAKFGLPEVSLGLIPGFGGTQRLARAVGIARARELIFTGRMLHAAEALSLGLVNRVVAHEALRPAVQETLDFILTRGPQAVAAAKQTINRGFDLDLDSGLALERDQFAALFTGSEPHEGTLAFIEKRAPRFGEV